MKKLNVCAQVETVRANCAARRRAAAPRPLALACAALALLIPALSAHADAPDFREGMSHTEVRRHGDEAMARGDVLAGVRHGGVTWS